MKEWYEDERPEPKLDNRLVNLALRLFCVQSIINLAALLAIGLILFTR